MTMVEWEYQTYWDEKERTRKLRPAAAKVGEGRFLVTLRRIPARIILAILGRDLNLNDPHTCVCGWVLRERLAAMQNKAASEINLEAVAPVDDIPKECASAFGGSIREWEDIYYGVTRYMIAPVIERAFARRLDEITGQK